MIVVLNQDEDGDLKPPQFFHSSYHENYLQAVKVCEFSVDFILENENIIEGELILYEEYIAARIKQRIFYVEIDLTITLKSDHKNNRLIFKDSQRQLKLQVQFHKQNEFNLFFNQIKKFLFQTNFEQRYSIIKKVGSGKTSLVYQARNRLDNRIYAVKFYSNIPSTIKRQIQILRILQHPNLVYFHEMFISKGQIYLIMDYEDGGTLLDKINQKQFMPMKQKIKFLIDMLNAFQFLRIKNIVHRDLKPQNILYSKKDSCYKISDFSLAVYENQPITKLVGTPGYIAPQLFESSEQIYANQYSDIFSLGLVYYQIATKQLYFKGQTSQALLRQNKKFKSLKKKKYQKQHISDLQYDILRMMIRTQVQNRKLSLQILQSSQLRKFVKIYTLNKIGSNISSSSSQNNNKKSRKNSDLSQFQKTIDEQNFVNAMKKILGFKNSS